MLSSYTADLNSSQVEGRISTGTSLVDLVHVINVIYKGHSFTLTIFICLKDSFVYVYDFFPIVWIS